MKEKGTSKFYQYNNQMKTYESQASEITKCRKNFNIKNI